MLRAVNKTEIFTTNSQSYSHYEGLDMKKTICCVALACAVAGTVLSGCTACLLYTSDAADEL